MMRLRLLTILMAVCAVMAFGSLADVATAEFVVANHSFESPGTTGWLKARPTSWSGDNGEGGLIDGPSYCPSGYTDTQAFVVDKRTASGGPSHLWQNVGMGTSVASPHVKLEVDVATRLDMPIPCSYTIGLWWDSDSNGSPDTVLASVTDPVTPNNTAFQLASVTAYNVGATVPVFVYLSSDGTGDHLQMLMDNVRVTAVPEPSTLILTVFGLIGLAAFIRRRK
jgi:hypothetical protein